MNRSKSSICLGGIRSGMSYSKLLFQVISFVYLCLFWQAYWEILQHQLDYVIRFQSFGTLADSSVTVCVCVCVCDFRPEM